MTQPAGERVARLEERMNKVEEGVANFRDFQTDVRKFITRSDTREEEREKLDRKRAKVHYWWLALLTGLIVSFFGWWLGWASNVHHISENSSAPTVTHAVESPQQAPKQDALQ